jgi:hypothetical protein
MEAKRKFRRGLNGLFFIIHVAFPRNFTLLTMKREHIATEQQNVNCIAFVE